MQRMCTLRGVIAITALAGVATAPTAGGSDANDTTPDTSVDPGDTSGDTTPDTTPDATPDATPDTTPDATPDATPGTSIIDVATANGNFTTLLAAVEAAGLTETLAGEGTFTVFAPTDAAFAALPEGTVTALLADIPTLTQILTYHVLGTEVPSSAVTTGPATTLADLSIWITAEGSGVMVNDANVEIPDVEASNGVIHVIDQVILPPTIVDFAGYAGAFETLLTAATAADLAETLDGSGDFTVFAPTDDAFAALPEGTVGGLLEDIPALT